MTRPHMPSPRPAEHLPGVCLQRFSEFLALRMGLYFPPERWGDLERALLAAAKDFRLDPLACLKWLLSSPLTASQIETLASHLTVGETYFFREPAVFAALREHILPDLIRRRPDKRMRVWSAGCSTGEEPYSIAITLMQTLVDFDSWNITLLASDINPRFLRKAALGVYDNWSFRNAPAGLKTGYFTQTGKRQFEITPRIRALPEYMQLNLVDDVYPAAQNNTNAMDIIFCRNVLMYFAPERAKAVVEKLCRSLVDGGWLIVSSIEAAQIDAPELSAVRIPDAILYRKGAGTAPAQHPPKAARAARQPPARDRKRAPSAPAAPQTDGAAPLLARTYADQGRLAEATYWCNRAMAGDKLNPEWPYLLASILHERGQTEEVIAALRRALYLEPDYVMAHFALGNLMLHLYDQREAAKYFRNALTILSGYAQEQALPGSDGITAGRLIEIIESTMAGERAHEAQDHQR